jgi:6-phosphogluconolactonase/glucosamine-6-phosphate isomerase/deaminase
VTGGSKADAVKKVFGASSDLPAARVHPVNGNLIWYITQDTASGITTRGK